MVIQGWEEEDFQFYLLFAWQSSAFMNAYVWSFIFVELLLLSFLFHTSEY